jgi:hypothetical protein
MSSRGLSRLGVANGPIGRFTPTHALNESQGVFVREFVANGGDRQKAARLAGYSDPRTEGYRLLNTQKVRDAIKREQERVIQCEGASLALASLLDLLKETTPANVRFQAARWILEAAGIGPVAQTERPNESAASISAMSIEELESFIAAGRETIRCLNQNYRG